MTFTDFLKKVHDSFLNDEADQWRYGQTVMNVLYDVWPEKYNEIKDSDINCFYNNRTVAMVIDKLEKEWEGNIMNNWTTCMKHIKEPDGKPCYINSWDKEYPSMIKSKTTYSDCMHDNCSSCDGTGIRKDGLGPCIHMMSCSCPKCSPRM